MMKEYDKCPICGQEWVGGDRSFLAVSWCANKHIWWTCMKHGCVLAQIKEEFDPHIKNVDILEDGCHCDKVGNGNVFKFVKE